MRGKVLRGWLQTSTTTWDDAMPFRIIRGGCYIPCTHAPRELEPSRLAALICHREPCVCAMEIVRACCRYSASRPHALRAK